MAAPGEGEAGFRRFGPVPFLDLERTPGHLIRRVQRVHTSLWSQLVGSQPTGPQFAVLSVLARTPDLDQSAVGLAASLDKSTGAEIVRRLVHNGWLIVTTDPADRRRKLLRLSRPASAALVDLTRTVIEVQRALLAPLSTAASARLVAQLAELAYAGDPPRLVAFGSASGPIGLDVSTTPGYLIRRAQQTHAARWTERFNGELTGPQYAVLCALAQHGRLGQMTVGDTAALDKSSAAEVVDRLIARHLVIASPDPDDRRRKQLRLSDTALTDMDRITSLAAAVEAELLNFLPAARRKAFLTDLASLVRRAG